MPLVIQSLHRDHAHMARLLKVLEREVDGFARGDSVDFETVQSIMDYCIEFPDDFHHPKEDLVLQQLRRRAPKLAEAVGDLEDEHREIGQQTRELGDLVARILLDAEIPRAAFLSAARDFIDNYRRHMDMEERMLFREAANTLTPEDWLVVGETLYARSDPVFGEPAEDRFRQLRASLAGDA